MSQRFSSSSSSSGVRFFLTVGETLECLSKLLILLAGCNQYVLPCHAEIQIGRVVSES